MDRQRIGRCSICGGDVMAHVGPWMGTVPPGPPCCASCGAVDARSDRVIPMSPRPVQRFPRVITQPFVPHHESPFFVADSPNYQWQAV